MSTETCTVQLTSINCGECGGTYAINERYRQQKEIAGGYWTCPYCKCSWGYGDQSENAKLKRQLKAAQDREQRQIASHDQTRTRLKHTERRRRAEKAAKTRLINRMKNGVCPCCDHHFADLETHMKAEHPDFSNHSTSHPL